MTILDTNVLSELMKARPEPKVLAWLNAQPATDIWTTAITVFEIWFGLNILVDGRKSRALKEAFEQALQVDLGGRVLDLDSPAAGEAARIAGKLRVAGKPVDFRDVLIAGTVAVKDATLATRNIRHFEQTGIHLVDPWNSP